MFCSKCGKFSSCNDYCGACGTPLKADKADVSFAVSAESANDLQKDNQMIVAVRA